jgi:peptide-N4-(N-acetyl-beta-glucosaminyl)asparagine amidase
MDPDEALARALQEEEDRTTAAALLAAEARDADGGGEHARRVAFGARLESGVRTALAFEDPAARAHALSVVPVDRLEAEAAALVAESEAAANAHDADDGDDAAGAKPLSLEDAVLLRALRWFKREFFTWCDKPACKTCGFKDVRHEGMGEPTAEERAHDAGRVETYRCPLCQAVTRFPRYNDARKLLETRTGRCGEWANAFTLVCRALGYDARWCLDWTDHVWTEVWSVSQRRWLHCDSCEDVCDKPLLYDKGWGKRLTYVVAFGKDEAVDVTRRYVADYAQCLGRRTECDEGWLAATLRALTARLRAGRVGDEVTQLATRDAMDADELRRAGAHVPPADVPFDDLPGRTTGSVAWRAARGELGRGKGAKPDDEPNKANDDDDDDDIAKTAKESARKRLAPADESLVVVAANRYATSTDPEQRETMGRILGNLVKEPGNPKYRRLKMSNAKVASAVGGDSFGKELLVALGFTARDEPEHGLLFALGDAAADISAVVPALELALRRVKAEDATGEKEAGTSGTASDDKARLEGMIREEYDRIMETEGVTPNEAATRALNTVRERVGRR